MISLHYLLLFLKVASDYFSITKKHYKCNSFQHSLDFYSTTQNKTNKTQWERQTRDGMHYIVFLLFTFKTCCSAHIVEYKQRHFMIMIIYLSLEASSGIPRHTSRSNLPARLKAGSKESGRLVAPTTRTRAVAATLFRSSEDQCLYKSFKG